MNPLIEKYGTESRWVNYRLVEKDGRLTKVPYSPVTGRMASSIKTSDWTTYDKAKLKDENVGIMFGPTQTLLGIDIDHCLVDGKLNHEQKEQIADLILEADSYTEISPSGNGLHIFIQIDGTEGLALESNRKNPYEIYTSGRYFTFTGDVYGNKKEVRTVTKDEALRLLAIIGYPWKEKEKVENELSPSSTPLLTDAEILNRMFSSKNGSKVKILYDGNISAYDDDASRADAALCSLLAFWTGKDGSAMERLWLASPLGKRQKTQERQDYRTRTINNSIAQCEETYTPPIELKGLTELDLLYVLGPQKNKVYLQNTENVCRVLRHHPDYKGHFRFDAFRNMIEFKHRGIWRQLEDVDDIRIQTGISILYPKILGKVVSGMVHDAIVQVSIENQYDSAADYLRSLKWDGVARVDGWLSDTYGTPNDAYHKAVGSNWLKGLVKRIMYPGCQFDYVIVLEGPQGIRKSTSFRVLGREWHVESNMGTDSKDFFMQFQGKAIVEFSEGETMNRTETKRMKGIITTNVDRFRPPYGRNTQDFPRRCVFCMTTNQDEYLKDETGNRRYLPVRVLLPKVNIEWLETNRDQLLAEAYERAINKNESIYEFPDDETKSQQALRMIQDPNADNVLAWYYKLTEDEREEGVTTAQIFKDCFGGYYSGKAIDRLHEMIIGNILRNLLNLTKERTMLRGVQANRWFKSGPITKKDEKARELTNTEILTGTGANW